MKAVWWFLFRAPLLSARGFLRLALILSVLFFTVHAAGLRNYTSVLSYTSPTSGMPDELTALLAALYLLSYFLFAGLVPILAIGAGLFSILNRLTGCRRAV